MMLLFSLLPEHWVASFNKMFQEGASYDSHGTQEDGATVCSQFRRLCLPLQAVGFDNKPPRTFPIMNTYIYIYCDCVC